MMMTGKDEQQCRAGGCDKTPVARGLCTKHYQRWRRHGDHTISLTNTDVPEYCIVDDCSKPSYRRGYCTTHYGRLRAHNDPNHQPKKHDDPTRESLLSEAVKEDTGCLIWGGGNPDTIHPRVQFEGKAVYVHRLFWKLTYGEWPGDDIVHSCSNRRCLNIDHMGLRENRSNGREQSLSMKGAV